MIYQSFGSSLRFSFHFHLKFRVGKWTGYKEQIVNKWPYWPNLILLQIQLWEEHNNGMEGSDGSQDSKGPKDGGHGGFKVMDLLEKVLKINNNKSKSCGNLHVLWSS